MTLLSNFLTRLSYQPASLRDQAKLFALVQSLANAQFVLADSELTRRIWQEVADLNLDVERVENLLYRCCFQDDLEALKEADQAFLDARRDRYGVMTHDVGIFEHC